MSRAEHGPEGATDLLALAERVESATGADEWLDADVHLALGRWRPPRAAKRDYAARWSAFGINYYQPGVTRLTASLDAVLALVAEKLPGWWWLVRSKDEGGAFANVGPQGSEPNCGGPCWPANAATPALALLAAFLRALVPPPTAASNRGGMEPQPQAKEADRDR